MTLNLQSTRSYLHELYENAGRWLWLASAVIGGLFAVIGYAAFKHATASYSDFVVGYITLHASGKAGEYAAAFCFIIGATIAFHALAYLMKRISTIADHTVAESFYTRIIIALIPAVMWAATSLWPQSHRSDFYWASVALILLTTLGAVISLSRPNVWLATNDVRLFSIVEGAILLPAASLMAMHGFAMIGKRAGLLTNHALLTDINLFYLSVWISGALGVAVAIVIGLSSKNAERATSLIRTLLCCAQIPALGTLLVIIPQPIWTPEFGAHYPDPIRTSNWILLSAIFAVGAADLVRLWRNANRNASSPIAVVSVITLIALIAYARTPVPAPLPLPVDDYHAAEIFVPWWAMVKHGLLPLWDFAPVRGLINYEAGMLAALFTDDTAAGLIATKQLHVLFLLLIAFPTIALSVGKWPAFLMLSFATLDEGPGGIDTIMASVLAILCWSWARHTRLQWLVIWFTLGVAAVLIAPGQGGVLVLATMPAGLWQFYHFVRDDRRLAFRAVAIVFVVTAALIITTPIGLMVLGAVRYGAEQSSVNGIANGIPWQFGTQKDINSWIFEVLRFSWLGVGVIAIVITLRTWAAAPQTPERAVALFAGTSVALLCILFVTRSVVRLDLGFSGRPGFATIWALTLLLPILLRYALTERGRLTALIASVGVGGMLTGNFGLVGLEFTYTRPLLIHARPGPEQYVARGSDLGLKNLGTVALEQAHAERLKTLKEQLDQLLTPTETFLDLTNNGAQYFYFDRPPPSEATAAYNLITPAQQLRTVKSVQAQSVPVILIGPHTVPVDGLYANLRTYLVYRYALLNYVPISIGGYDYMIRADRVEKVRKVFELSSLDDTATTTVLERNFPISDLGNLPRSMGRSTQELAAHTRLVRELDVSKGVTVDGAERARDGTFIAQGTPLAVTFDLNDFDLAGRDAGVLQFDLSCGDVSLKLPMAVLWTSRDAKFAQGSVQFSGRNATHIVPLDAAPRWLLSPGLSTLTVAVNKPVICGSLKLSNVKLMQRIDADEIDLLAGAGR